ncbi:MAG: ABC transporter permease [Oscillospiraceae bacterium]
MKKKNWLSSSYIGLFMAFLYAPIMVLIIYSFNDAKGRTFTTFTTKWYVELLHNSAVIDALITTLTVALISSVIACIIGTAAAIGLDKMHKKTKGIIMNFTYLPIINPEIITGVAFMLLFVAARGILTAINAKTGANLQFQFGLGTLCLAHITFNIPYVILNVMPKLRQMDHSIVEAAMDLGCSPRQAFFKVAIHEIKPGIIAGFLMALTFSIDDFIISYFTTGTKHQPLSVLIYSMTKKRVSPEINALSTVMFVIVLSVLLLSNIYGLRKEKQLKTKRKGGGSF